MATLLYVDDEVPIGRIIDRFFTRRGDKVLLARSIAEAQQLLDQCAPTAVFIDVWLGDESGFELFSWIEDNRPDLAGRVSFVTGDFVDDHASARPYEHLGCPFIQKPFELTALARWVDGAEERVVT